MRACDHHYLNMAVNIIKHFLVVTLLCLSVVESRIDKEEKLKEISEVFNEIEKNQEKLKTEFKVILTEKEQLELKEEQLKRKEEEIQREEEENNKKSVIRNKTPECNCVPYHLCSPETGMQVIDGKDLLGARFSPPSSVTQQPRLKLCEDPIEICCMKTSVTENQNSNKIVTETSTIRKCGYGYQDESKQAVSPFDDPSLTTPGQYPWTVMINKNSSYVCAGSLIHPAVVLTAAHCVNAHCEYYIRAGEWDATSKAEPFKHQDRKVADIIRHPKFQLDNLIYDAALLILDEEIELQENINTACLTKSAPEPLIASSDKCLATGWGAYRRDKLYSKKMRKIEFSLKTDKKCQNCMRTTRLGYTFLLHESFLCAQGLHGSDACHCNDGAPLVCSISQQPNRYQQVGLVSWGLSCADPYIPTVFTKISQIRDWVDAIFDKFGYSKNFYVE